jgi:hypothetical protein
MDKISHKLCLVRLTDKEDVAFGYFVKPATDYIQSKHAISLRSQDVRELIKLYRSCVAVPSARVMADSILEAIWHWPHRF